MASRAGKSAGMAAILFLAGWAAVSAGLGEGRHPWIWPPPGVALAGLLVLGFESLPGVFLGSFLGAAFFTGNLPAAAATSAVFTLSAFLSAWIVRRAADGRVSLSSLRGVAAYVVLGCFLGILISAAGRYFSVRVLFQAAGAGPWERLRYYWLADMLGALTIGAAILSVGSLRRLPRDPRRYLEGAGLLVAVGLVSALVIHRSASGTPHDSAWAYALFPLLMWAAFRFGPGGTAVLATGIALDVMAASRSGIGAFGAIPDPDRIWLVQAFIAVLTLTGLLVAAMVTEMREARRMARNDADLLRMTIESAQEAICLSDGFGRMLEVNPAACALLGYSREELLAIDGRALVPESGMAEVLAMRERVRAGETVIRDWTLVRKDGSLLKVHSSLKLLPDGRVQSIARDVSEHSRAEDALRESEKKYRDLVETSNDLIWSVDLEGRWTFVNRLAALRIYGVEPEQLLGRPFTYFQSPDYAERDMEAFRRILAGELLFGYETRHLRPDGSAVLLRFNAIAIRSPEGVVLGTTGTATDITERKRSEDALAQTRERLALIAEHSSDMITSHNAEGCMDYVSPSCLALLGYQSAEMLGRLPSEFLHPDDLETLQASYRQALSGTARVVLETRFRRKDGSHVWTESTATAVTDPRTGALVQFISSTRDISARKSAESLQLGQERVLQSIALAEPLGTTLDLLVRVIEGEAPGCLGSVLIVDDTGQRMRVGAAPNLPPVLAAALEGFPVGPNEGSCGSAAFTGQPSIVEDISTHPAWEKYRELALGLGIRACWSQPIILPGGVVAGTFAMSLRESRRPMEHEIKLIERAGQLAEIAIVRQRAAEEQQKLTALVHNSGDFIGVASLDHRVNFVNEAGRRMVGMGGGVEVRALSISDFHPEGAPQPVSSRDVADALDARGLWEGETQLRHFVTGRVIEVHASIFAVRDVHTGEPLSFAIVARDVSERRRLEEQLLHSQKLESVGRLAGGVAHDFNNLLTAINGYAELAQMKLQPGSAVASDLDQIRKAGERAAHLTAQLLAFARKQIVEFKRVDLDELTGNMEQMLRRVIGSDVELVTRLEAGGAAIRAGTGQVEQVLVNLAVNARDAMPGGGRLTIETSRSREGTQGGPRREDVAPGEYLLLSVSDTGSGMSDDVKAHVFEPFFTTKELGKGTGLGLATCYGIVKQGHGHIWVDSAPGMGTTFRILWPVAAGPAQPAQKEQHARLELPRGSETVLLAEDEKQVRDLAARILIAQGYRVIEAEDGEQALKLAQQQSGFQLLVTDLVMPRMSGRDLADRVRALRPGIPVLFISGYSEMSPGGQEGNGLDGPFLQKPFTPAALAWKAREVLDRVAAQM